MKKPELSRAGTVAHREAQLMIAIGMMGVGKSYETNQLLSAYEKLRRKLIIFDPNNEDIYFRYPALEFDILDVQRHREYERKHNNRVVSKSERNIQNLPDGCVVRIAPFTIYGDEMNLSQKKLTMLTILENFRGGMIFLEDVNKYISNFQSEEVLGSFKAIRHKSQDIVMHMQSISPLRPIHFEACSVIRMHQDGFDVGKIKPRLLNHFEILKIAQLIVEREYLQGNIRFHCYVHLKQKKIKGVTLQQFERACTAYLTTNRNEYKAALYEVAAQNKRTTPTYADHEKAMFTWIMRHLHYLPDAVLPAKPAKKLVSPAGQTASAKNLVNEKLTFSHT